MFDSAKTGVKHRLESLVLPRSFFWIVSLIPIPNYEDLRMRIWLVLCTAKNEDYFILLESKLEGLTHLPFDMKVLGRPNEPWTSNTTRVEILSLVTIELGVHLFKEQPNLGMGEALKWEWDWHTNVVHGGEVCIILLFIPANNAQEIFKKKTKVAWYLLSQLPKFDNSLPHTKISHMFFLSRLEKGDGCRLAIKCHEALSLDVAIATASGSYFSPQSNWRKRQAKSIIINEGGSIGFTTALNNGWF